MKLTKTQLEKISRYLDEIGFKYIDVQMEIVDHIASAVEEKMTEDPTLTFEKAVNLTRASFGRFGFAKIERSIVKGLNRRYWKLFLHHFFSFFDVKYIWIVFLSACGIYQIQNLIANQISFFILFVGFIALFYIRFYKDLKPVTYKKYMVYKVSGRYVEYLGLFLIVVFEFVNEPTTAMLFGLNKSYLIVSFLLTLFTIYYIAALKTEKIGALESKAIASKLHLLSH